MQTLMGVCVIYQKFQVQTLFTLIVLQNKLYILIHPFSAIFIILFLSSIPFTLSIIFHSLFCPFYVAFPIYTTKMGMQVDNFLCKLIALQNNLRKLHV